MMKRFFNSPAISKVRLSSPLSNFVSPYIGNRWASCLASAKVSSNHVIADFQDSSGPARKLRLHNFWLRENCQCPACFHQQTFQRQISETDIPQNVSPISTALVDSSLQVVWSDKHTSTYPESFFQRHFSKKSPLPRILWDAKPLSLPEMNFGELHPVATPEARRKFLTLLHQYGFVLVNGTPYLDAQGTGDLITSIGPIQQTFYGGLWDFSNELLQHGDTAYTSLAIGLHTDGSYFQSPPGLQFLHNISHNGTGGMSMIADGFHLAERLRSEHPDTFHYLTTNKIKFWYNDENECLFAEDYVIRLNEQGTVVQFRWNDLDRYPPPPQDLEATSTYYQHTHILNQFIADPRFQYTFKLRPGTTLCVDNWRLMHGRTAFTGLRRMVGAYIQRDTYESRCRHLGVQIDE